jgi:dUTPase
MATYRLELQVSDQGTPYYPTVGTVEYLTPDNAGYDLKVVEDVSPTTVATLVPLGVVARMVSSSSIGGKVTGEDSHFTLEPRSSIYKTGYMMANSRGIIDKSYRGQLMAPMVSVGSNAAKIEAGTRLFQVIAPGMGYISEVAYVMSIPAHVSASGAPASTRASQAPAPQVRGTGGFGSTGVK